MADRPAERGGSLPEIVLDISRLISRIGHHTPTGVDRVELAYARELLRRVPDRLAFGAVHPLGAYGRVPTKLAMDFLDRTEAAWRGVPAAARTPNGRRAAMMRTLWDMRPRSVPGNGARRIYLQSSPHHLHREGLVRDILRRERAQFICLIHDLIPIEFPEYARPGGAAMQLRRIDTIARLASAAITNSAVTRESFLPHMHRAGRDIPVRVAHLGLDRLDAAPVPAGAEGRPYFVCLGTIEPRKNHLLLLHVWRDLSHRFGADRIPRLVVIGRRGWENEQVVDLLERSPGLVGCVEERAKVADGELAATLAGARALLLPSFAEGFGMPVPEALAMGVPVLCSDIPALREAGGEQACYLDPLDGPAWRDTIMMLANEAEPDRIARRAAVRDHRAADWAGHMSIVLDVMEKLAP